MNIISLGEFSGLQVEFILTNDFNYEFNPKIFLQILESSNNRLIAESNINNKTNYREYWDTMVAGKLNFRLATTLDILEETYSLKQVNDIVMYMRNKFKGKVWKPDNFFAYLETALENNK